MKLLVFAHRGEAFSFLHHDQYLPEKFHFDGLFFSEEKKSYLLITGEGPKEACEKTVAVLSSYKDKIDQVVNIGLAGSLTPKLKKHDIAWVRTSYAHNSTKMEFKSYTANFHSKIDCLTSFHRVMEQSEKKALSSFADIVDRELWSIMSASHLLKVDCLALKIISDENEESDFCETVKSEAKVFSEFLYKEWTKFLNQSSPIDSIKLKPIFNSPSTSLETLLSDSSFHFTTTQKRQALGLNRSLKLKGIMNDDELLSFADTLKKAEPELTPKNLTRKLLTSLEEINNPLKKKIKIKIEEALTPLTNAGISVHTDPDLESDRLQMSFTLSSVRDQKKLQLAMEQFQFQKIKDIFSGKIEDDL